MEVGGFDFTKQDVLDLAGAKEGLGGHSLGRFFRGIGACEKYHKLWVRVKRTG
jgi:hypothetical protein